MSLAFQSWGAWCGIAALLGSAALIFVYLYLMSSYEAEEEMQEARKEKVVIVFLFFRRVSCYHNVGRQRV